MKRLFEQKKREIGFLTLFFGIILSFAWDRIYFFAYLNEDAGWRQVSEIGVLMSRGTAAALSFIYPCMLLSMSKNIMTILRRDLTFINYVTFHHAENFTKCRILQNYWTNVLTFIRSDQDKSGSIDIYHLMHRLIFIGLQHILVLCYQSFMWLAIFWTSAIWRGRVRRSLRVLSLAWLPMTARNQGWLFLSFVFISIYVTW